MDDTELLELLQRKESAAGHYVHGELGDARERAMRAYHRLPYGNEQEGWSDVVASDVQDSVEWILPSLLNTFTSTDKAVAFEPTKANEVKGAEQATDACNYVFYKQNNGFLVLYTAIKDALSVKNCAVHWYKESQEVVSSQPFKGASEEMLAMLLQEGGELEYANPEPAIGEDGQPLINPMPDGMGGVILQPVTHYTGRIKTTEKRTICKVEAFNPAHLLIEKDWTSPLLADCPYVARLKYVSSSDIKAMGLKATPDELKASDVEVDADEDRLMTVDRQDSGGFSRTENDDQDDITYGWLRIEYVLADIDGDGIAERVKVTRLRDKILDTEVVSHVPIATTSPVLNPHRWDGMSIEDLVGDIQKLHTEILRGTLDNLKLTTNPRKKLLTDANGTPMANLDDLLDSRIGGIVRMRSPDAVTEEITSFAGAAAMPMLEYVQGMRENRTGVSRTSMGLNPDSLNNTAKGRQIDQTAAMQRIELIARIFAETLVKPIFQGILKLLTDGEMQKLSFKLRDEFVEYDPQEWRDQYDMTINVGLGTGDKQAQSQMLTMILQLQQAGMAMGLATPAHLYHTGAKIIENAGFKDVQNFIQDPSKLPPQPPKPDPALMVEQAKMQADVQKTQAQLMASKEIEQMRAASKLQEVQANLELQAANDARDSEREQAKAQFEQAMELQRIELEKWKSELDARVKLRIAQIGKEQSGDELMAAVGDAEALGQPNPIDQLAQMHAQTIAAISQMAETMARPKQIVRDAQGRAQGVI
jgi:hypothetical protein